MNVLDYTFSCTVLYCTVLYRAALHCTALHCTALLFRFEEYNKFIDTETEDEDNPDEVIELEILKILQSLFGGFLK